MHINNKKLLLSLLLGLAGVAPFPVAYGVTAEMLPSSVEPQKSSFKGVKLPPNGIGTKVFIDGFPPPRKASKEDQEKIRNILGANDSINEKKKLSVAEWEQLNLKKQFGQESQRQEVTQELVNKIALLNQKGEYDTVVSFVRSQPASHHMLNKVIATEALKGHIPMMFAVAERMRVIDENEATVWAFLGLFSAQHQAALCANEISLEREYFQRFNNILVLLQRGRDLQRVSLGLSFDLFEHLNKVGWPNPHNWCSKFLPNHNKNDIKEIVIVPEQWVEVNQKQLELMLKKYTVKKSAMSLDEIKGVSNILDLINTLE